MRALRAVVARTGRALLERVEVAEVGWQRVRGLMLRKELAAGEGLLIPGCGSVHMFFMRFPIDLVYLDREDRVVKIVDGIKPWRLSACLGARSVLEIAAGRAREVGLQVGDSLRFERRAASSDRG